MAAKFRTVKWQKIREIETKKKYNGESSAYWNWVDANMYQNEEGRPQEPVLANPDNLGEVDPERPNLTRKLMKAGINKIKFSKREQEVLLAFSSGMTQDQIAAHIGVSRRRVRTIVARIQKKGENFLGAILAHGGLLSRVEEE